MNECVETIRRSMDQTVVCQGMARKLLGYCELLVERVKCLEVENKELKKELEKKC